MSAAQKLVLPSAYTRARASAGPLDPPRINHLLQHGSEHSLLLCLHPLRALGGLSYAAAVKAMLYQPAAHPDLGRNFRAVWGYKYERGASGDGHLVTGPPSARAYKRHTKAPCTRLPKSQGFERPRVRAPPSPTLHEPKTSEPKTKTPPPTGGGTIYRPNGRTTTASSPQARPWKNILI